MTDDKLTQPELFAMFGEKMPIEAAKLIFDAPDTMTIGEVRRQLRGMAVPYRRHAAATTAIHERLKRYLDGRNLDVEYICSTLATDVIAAVDAVTPVDDNPWIEWKGSGSPPAVGLVEVRFRNRYSEKGAPENYRWSHTNGGNIGEREEYDIVAYRVVKP